MLKLWFIYSKKNPNNYKHTVKLSIQRNAYCWSFTHSTSPMHKVYSETRYKTQYNMYAKKRNALEPNRLNNTEAEWSAIQFHSIVYVIVVQQQQYLLSWISVWCRQYFGKQYHHYDASKVDNSGDFSCNNLWRSKVRTYFIFMF